MIVSEAGHRNSACDGVGRLVKHQATLPNLREPERNAIPMAKDMVTPLFEKINSVHVIQLERNEVSSHGETKQGGMTNSACVSQHTLLPPWLLKKSSEADICLLYAARTVFAPFKETGNIDVVSNG